VAIASQKISSTFAPKLLPPEIPLDTLLDLWYLKHGPLLFTVRVVDIQDDAHRADFLTRNFIRVVGYVRANSPRDWVHDYYTLDHGPYRLRLHHSVIHDTILSRLELKEDNEHHRKQSVANTNAAPG
jgi:hypothetical protein